MSSFRKGKPCGYCHGKGFTWFNHSFFDFISMKVVFINKKMSCAKCYGKGVK